MESNFKLNRIDAIAIIIMIMINKLVLNIPFFIVNLTGTGSVINILYIGLIDFIFVIAINKLFSRFNNQDLIDVSNFLGGKVLKYISSIICVFVLFLVSFITVIDFTNILQTIYFSNFSIFYILLFFIIPVYLANNIGLKGISKTSSFVVILTLLSVILTFITSLSNFSYTNLTPFLGKDLKTTFVDGLTNMYSLYIIIYFYFMKPLLKEQSDFKYITYTSLFISIFLIILTIIPMLSLFNLSTTAEPINSLFFLIRQIELGHFIQRVDSLFVLLWILSILCYLSFIIFIINNIIKKALNLESSKMVSYCSCPILFTLCILPFNIAQIHFIENTIYKYVLIGFMFIYGISILLLGYLKKGKR